MSPLETCVVLLTFFTSFEKLASAVTQTDVDVVNADCQKCDAAFRNAIVQYQQNYGTTWRTSREAAQYFCGQFDAVNQCYRDCLGGKSITYLSVAKQQFYSFFAASCDPVCYGTAVPWCYMKFVGQFSLAQSCDANQRILKNNLRQCLVEELFYKQQCNGSCTVGQRKANFLLMQLEAQCLIPLNSQDDCFNWVQYCIGNYYGDSGNDFALYSEASLQKNNSLSCNFYHTSFEDCLQQSINGRVSLGLAPSVTTYNAPCHAYQDQVDYLSYFESERLTKVFCQNPSLSLNDTCDASGLPVTVSRSQPATTRLATSSAPAAASTVSPNGASTFSPNGVPSSPAGSASPDGITPAAAATDVVSAEASLTTTASAVTTIRTTPKKSLLDGFFDLPSTTPEPTTTRRPRAAFSFGGGGLGGGGLLFNGPTTAAAGATGDDTGDDATLPVITGVIDIGPAKPAGSPKPPRVLIGAFDSSTTFVSQPALMLSMLLLFLIMVR